MIGSPISSRLKYMYLLYVSMYAYLCVYLYNIYRYRYRYVVYNLLRDVKGCYNTISLGLINDLRECSKCFPASNKSPRSEDSSDGRPAGQRMQCSAI